MSLNDLRGLLLREENGIGGEWKGERGGKRRVGMVRSGDTKGRKGRGGMGREERERNGKVKGE